MTTPIDSDHDYMRPIPTRLATEFNRALTELTIGWQT